MTERIIEIANSPDQYGEKKAKEFIIGIYKDIKKRAKDLQYYYSQNYNKYTLYRSIDKEDIDFIERIKVVYSDWNIINSNLPGIFPIAKLFDIGEVIHLAKKKKKKAVKPAEPKE